MIASSSSCTLFFYDCFLTAPDLNIGTTSRLSLDEPTIQGKIGWNPPPPIVIWLIVNKKNWLLSSYHFKLSFQSSPAFSFTVAVFPFLTRHGRCEQHLCAAARRNAQRQSDSTFARVSNFFLFLTTRHLSLWHFRKANVSECVCVCVMPTMAAVVFETRRWWHLCRRHIIQSRHLYKTSVS